MATDTPNAGPETVEELIERLGGIPASRIRMTPRQARPRRTTSLPSEKGPGGGCANSSTASSWKSR